MVKLKTELMKNGFRYKQIKRTNTVAMYRAYLKERNDLLPCSFEVFKIKIRKSGFCMGSPTPETEVFPSNESFGKHAWSIGGLDAENRANILYNELNKEGSQQKKKMINFGDFSIIKYLNKKDNYMVLENGKLYSKPKEILSKYVIEKLNKSIDGLTAKDLGRLIFE